MRRVLSTPRFERRLSAFLARHPGLVSRVKEVMTVLAGDNKSARLKFHKLGGLLKGSFAASISYEHRIVFVLSRDEICFIDIGTHDDVYR